MTYTATVNVPGYLPMADEPATFDTAAEAWAYLVGERERDEGYEGTDSDDTTMTDIAAMVKRDTVGTIYGPTPNSDSDHDLGLAYTVDWYDDDTGEGHLMTCSHCGAIRSEQYGTDHNPGCQRFA